MNGYTTINILDMIEAVGENEVRRILSNFICPPNSEIENFAQKSAVEFAKRKMSVTHLVINEGCELMAFFTLTHKAIELSNKNLSVSVRKKIERYAQLNEETNNYMVSAFLIAQFGKNYADGNNLRLDGDSLMESAISVLEAVQHEVGGGIVYLECEEKPCLLSFYQNPRNIFRIFGERYSKEDNTKYIQLLRFF